MSDATDQAAKKPEWEVIVGKTGEGPFTDRMPIDGGWLYRTAVYSVNGGHQVAMVFVPTNGVFITKDAHAIPAA